MIRVLGEFSINFIQDTFSILLVDALKIFENRLLECDIIIQGSFSYRCLK